MIIWIYYDIKNPGLSRDLNVVVGVEGLEPPMSFDD